LWIESLPQPPTHQVGSGEWIRDSAFHTVAPPHPKATLDHQVTGYTANSASVQGASHHERVLHVKVRVSPTHHAEITLDTTNRSVDPADGLELGEVSCRP
jgi:hypothetical protein